MSAGADLIGRARRSFGSVRNDGLAPHIARMSARNVLANHRRGEVRRQARSVELDAEMVDLYGAAPDNGVELTAIGEVFRSLPDDDRELLSLVAWEGLDRRQIATALGVSRNAVRIRLHRARPLLRPGEHPGERDGWQMRIDTKLFKPDQTFVWTIADLPGGGEQHEQHSHERPGGALRARARRHPQDEGGRLDVPPGDQEGRLARRVPGGREDRGRGPAGDREARVEGHLSGHGHPSGQPGRLRELRRQDTPVGDDWIVWEAEEEKGVPGKVILLVTDKRYDRNPVYNGLRDNVIHD
ncbi:RNA polymerase sigma factor [Microtetraspora malaysiensis]|uniref:RNA polymerase sigma factor n=1 Tax=Microtetraspora malaysiensis TaxID=161358 RepID=UPI003D948A82